MANREWDNILQLTCDELLGLLLYIPTKINVNHLSYLKSETLNQKTNSEIEKLITFLQKLQQLRSKKDKLNNKTLENNRIIGFERDNILQVTCDELLELLLYIPTKINIDNLSYLKLESLDKETSIKINKTIDFLQNIQVLRSAVNRKVLESKCNNNHLFDEWQKVSETTYKRPRNTDKDFKPSIDEYEQTEITTWVRTCKECSYTEKSLTDPNITKENQKKLTL